MSAETLFASAARTATVNSAETDNRSHKGMLLMIDVTAVTTGTLTPTVQVYDPAEDAWGDFVPFAAISGTGRVWYLMAVGFLAGASGDVAAPVNRTLPMARIRVSMVKSDSSSWTYSVGRAFLE
jgi:hypothetical protein